MKCVKSLKSALNDEHDMHRSMNVECFRSFVPPADKEKAFNSDEYLKALKGEHKGYDEKCGKTFDQFEEKMKTVVGDQSDGDADDIDQHTGWITAKMSGDQVDHRANVKGIATAMCKGFSTEQDDTQKTMDLKGLVETQLGEIQERETKWKLLSPVLDMFDAFVCSFLSEDAKSVDFDTLLDEMISMMKGATSAKSLKLDARMSIKIGSTSSVEHVQAATAETKEFESFLLTRELARSLVGPLNAFISRSKDAVKDIKDPNQKR